VLSATNKLLQYIFRELEISPNRSFRASELKHISPVDFRQLLKEKLLKPYRYEQQGDNYPCTDGCSSCKAGYMRRVNGAGNKWEAVCPDGEADTKSIPLSDDDINKYSFDINRFVEEIHNSCGLTGKTSKMDEWLYFIGVGEIKGKQAGLMLALLNNKHTAESLLLSIPQRLPDYQTKIVLLPFFNDLDQNTRKTLEDNQVYLIPLATILQKDIDYDSLTKSRSPKEKPAEPSSYCYIVTNECPVPRNKYLNEKEYQDTIEIHAKYELVIDGFTKTVHKGNKKKSLTDGEYAIIKEYIEERRILAPLATGDYKRSYEDLANKQAQVGENLKELIREHGEEGYLEIEEARKLLNEKERLDGLFKQTEQAALKIFQLARRKVDIKRNDSYCCFPQPQQRGSRARHTTYQFNPPADFTYCLIVPC
jgi:hypothetical protein